MTAFESARQVAAEVTTPAELAAAYRVLEAYEAALVEAGRRLHREGFSWAALAEPFGISRQGARKRWADDVRIEP